MTTRAQRLAAFLAEGAALPFIWGDSCCTTWVASWIIAERGVDPARDLRGSFRCHLGSARLVRRAGSLVALVSGPLAAAGLAGTAAPRVGDVGVVETRLGELAAICCGERWAVKTRDGLAILPATLIKGWRL